MMFFISRGALVGRHTNGGEVYSIPEGGKGQIFAQRCLFFFSFCNISLSLFAPPQWMYIIPIVLFLMMSGAPDAGGQGGGNGASAGGGGR